MPTQLKLPEFAAVPVRPRRKAGAFWKHRPQYKFVFSRSGVCSRAVTPSSSRCPDFVAQESYFDFRPFAGIANHPISRTEADLISIFQALYLADRYAPRRPNGDSHSAFWRRSIEVEIRVARPSLFESIKAELLDALDFLTEDDWDIRFSADRLPLSEELHEQADLNLTRPEWVALFSGGLDCSAGIAHMIDEGHGPGLLVSGYTHSRLRWDQKDLVALFQNIAGIPIRHLAFGYGMPQRVEPSSMESSQRCRALMHVGCGLIAARRSGLSRLQMFENGIGAFNLPCNSAQFGSQNSRAAHPVFLSRFCKFVSSALQTAVEVDNPFVLMTKGETLRDLEIGRWERLLSKSFSCDFYPNRMSKSRQCGTCPSCLIRRAGFLSSGFMDPAANYSFDVFGSALSKRKEKLSANFSRVNQFAQRVRSGLSVDNPWAGIQSTFIDLLEYDSEIAAALSIGPDEIGPQFCMLLNGFAEEWKTFAAQVESPS